MLFIHVKKYYENITSEEVQTDRYNTLHISPVHIHKNKKSHKEAILVLGQEIVDHMKQHRHPLSDMSQVDLTATEIAVEN